MKVVKKLVTTQAEEEKSTKRSEGTYCLAISDDDSVNDATGTKFEELTTHLLVQTTVASFSDTDVEPEKGQKQIEVVLGALLGIAPRDELEGMLAAQMVGIHNLSMEMMAAATKGAGHVTLRVNSAVKLSHLFLAQIEALNRYRGKGQQKVTVEHVTVHQGGQAIVGVIESKQGEGEPGGKK